MQPGWHFLSDDDNKPALGSACFLDTAGAAKGMQSGSRLCRVYYKGTPTIGDLVPQVLPWVGRARVQLGNEPNHPGEGWGGGITGYKELFYGVKGELPGVRLYWAAPSPGFIGWQDWYNGAENAEGLTVHAYGMFTEMQAITQCVLDRFPGKPIWVSECNFGPGPTRNIDRNAWARDHLKPFLDWCGQQSQIEAVSYFAYRWPHADMPMATPVDGAGTEIETVLRSWKMPTTPPPPIDPFQPNPDGSSTEVDASGNYYNGEFVTEEDMQAITDLQNKVAALEARDGLITAALCDLLQGKIKTGADSVAGYVVALQGGTPLPFTPSFPADVTLPN